MDRIDKTSFEQFFDFNLNDCCFPGLNWTKLLPDWLGIRIRFYFMFDYSCVNAWNFLVRPDKNVEELF
jgi:hypothetical protein